MEKYNYLESMKQDIMDYLNENYDKDNVFWDKNFDEFYEELYDELWVADSVTGNASGSYTCNTWRAEEMVCHNTDLLCEAIEDFGNDIQCYKRALQSAEYADVTIRCYLLPTATREALAEWWPTKEETE